MITIREKTADEKIADVIAKYKSKLDAYKDSIPLVFAADGTSQQAKLTALSTAYLATIANRNAEIEALEEESGNV
jgi:hypothetical protein